MNTKKKSLAEQLGEGVAEALKQAPPPPAGKGPPTSLLSELNAEGVFVPLMASKSPPPAVVSEVMARSVHRFIATNFGLDGIIVVMRNRRSVGRVIFWSTRDRVWKELEFEDGENSLTSHIYHNADYGFAPTLGAIALGFPLAQNMQKDFNSIAALIDKRHGREEEDLARFDRLRVADYSSGERSRGLFCGKAYEIWLDEDSQWNFRTGIANKKEFHIRKDFPKGAAVADDAEWQAKRGLLLEKLAAYCGGYALARDVDGIDAPLAKDYKPHADAEDEVDRVDLLSQSPMIKAGSTCTTGNAWLDDFFTSLATMFAPVPLRPLVCCIGVSGAGKSAAFRLLNAAFGSQILRIDLDKETFIEGGSLPRTREHRAKLPGARGGVSMDLATNSSLDSGFVKSLCANEEVSFGGMYKTDITRPLEFTGYFSANEMPKLVDNSDGTTERLWFLPFKKKYRGTAAERTHEEMLAEWKPLFPVLRRELLEFIKALVLNLKCKVPHQHPLLLEAKQASIEGGEYALKTFARKFFRPVGAADEGDFAFNYRESGRALFNIPVGSRSKTGYCAGGDEDRNAKWRGFRALAALWEHADKTGDDRNVAQQATITRLLREGQSWNYDKNRRAFTGRVHTLEFIEHLHEYLDGKQQVLEFLRAFYGGQHRDTFPAVETPRELEDALLDDEMKAVFARRADEAVPEGGI